MVGNVFSWAFSKKTPFILNQFMIVLVKTIHREGSNEVISLMNPFKDKWVLR